MPDMTITDEYRKELLDYRRQLSEIENESQQQYDKYIMSLGGGAFGISFTFVNDIVGPDPEAAYLLVSAWISWGLTILFGLFSFYASVLAARGLTAAVDHALASGSAESLQSEAAYGWGPGLTDFFNIGAGVMFGVGICALSFFVLINY